MGWRGGAPRGGFCQGGRLGGLPGGVKLQNGAVAGGAFDWLTRFSVVTGLGVIGGDSLLGATWLNMKTEGPLRDWARTVARRSLYLTLFALAVVSIYTPLKFPDIA